MKQTSVIKHSVAGLAIGLMSSAQAATPVDANTASFSELKKQFTISSSKQLLSTSQDSLKILSNRQDLNKTTHVRMQQTYLGVPVMGGYAIAHIKNNAQKGFMGAGDSSVTMNGTVYSDLAADLAKPDANLFKNAKTALDIAKKNYAGKALSEEKSSVIVYVDDKNKAHWAYKVSFVVTPTDSIPKRPTFIMKAENNDVVVEWNDIKSATTQVQGIGYGGNKRVGEYQYGKDYVSLEITRDEDEQVCFMENKDVKVVDMDHGYSSYKKDPMTFKCGDEELIGADMYWTGYKADGYDEINGAYSPSNDAMYGGYVIKHMYHDWYGLQVLTNSDGSPMQLVMRVHYGSSYQNAFWDGKQMTFGDGGYMMYPLVSLGVGAHEVSHGFTEQNSDLAYYGQSGGMNEAFSDMAAQAAIYYSTGEPSWMVGERIMKESSGYEALRYMDMPSKDGISIDTAEDYYNGLDVHYSSGVYNRLFYLMANQEGWNTRKAFDVMVKANQDYWTPYSSFKKGACGILSAAEDLGYELDGIKDSLDKVKIDFEACS